MFHRRCFFFIEKSYENYRLQERLGLQIRYNAWLRTPHFHSFLPARDIRFPFTSHSCRSFSIKCNHKCIPPKIGNSGAVKDDVENLFRDGTVAILALGLRSSHVRSLSILEFYVSQCRHVRHPLTGSAPGISSKSRSQFTRRLIEFVLVLMRIPPFHCVGDRVGHPRGVFNPPTDSTLSSHIIIH